MNNLIKLEKNTLISVVLRIIFIAKKSPPTMKRAIKKEPNEPISPLVGNV
jgi:hypothetical protein